MYGKPTDAPYDLFLEFQGESHYFEKAMHIFCQQLVWLASGQDYGKNPKADFEAFELLLRLGSDNLGDTCSTVCRIQLTALKNVLFTPYKQRWADQIDLKWASDDQVIVDNFSRK